MSITQKYVVVTRSATQATTFAHALQHHGAIPVVYPCRELVSILSESQLYTLVSHLYIGKYDWLVVTSANAVRTLHRQCQHYAVECVIPAHMRIAAIGQQTAQVVHEYWGCTVDLVTATPNATSLVADLHNFNPLRVCWLTTPQAPNHFNMSTYAVDRIDVYDCVLSQLGPDFLHLLRTRSVDVVTWHSGSAVHAFVDRMIQLKITRKDFRRVAFAAFGQSSLRACCQLGITPQIYTPEMQLSAWIHALMTYFHPSGD